MSRYTWYQGRRSVRSLPSFFHFATAAPRVAGSAWTSLAWAVHARRRSRLVRFTVLGFRRGVRLWTPEICALSCRRSAQWARQVPSTSSAWGRFRCSWGCFRCSWGRVVVRSVSLQVDVINRVCNDQIFANKPGRRSKKKPEIPGSRCHNPLSTYQKLAIKRLASSHATSARADLHTSWVFREFRRNGIVTALLACV